MDGPDESHPLYPPSWVDLLIDRIDAVPGPAWVPYVLVLVVVAVVSHAAAWADGFVPFGIVDPYVGSLAIYVIGGYAAIHYLDGAAERAWAIFRPAITGGEVDMKRVAYELTTMPSRPVLGCTVLGVAAAIVYAAGQYGAPLDLANEPLTFVVATVVSLISFAGFAVFVYHTIRQLRLIGRAHGFVDQVDLLNLAPLHAFSGVTAVTGVILIALNYVSALTDPATFTNPALFGPLALSVILAIACFVVPLYGMHQRIEAEKSRRLAEVNGRLDRALRDLDHRADAGDLSDADAVNKHLTSLLAQREVIAKTPTWPWSTETLRGFTTALVLPIVLWLVFRILERQLA